MKKIAILGGGGTGLTMAADLTLKGHEVRLYEEKGCWENLRDVQELGGIRMEGKAGSGFAKISCLTDSLAEAVNGADVILAAMIAMRHQKLAEELGPTLTDGQVVCYSAGNCGTLLLRKQIPAGVEVITGEMQGNVYPCRLIGKAVVSSAFPYMTKKAAAYPAKDTEALISAMEEVYPCTPAKNVLEAAFNSPNISIHLAGSLLNTCAIEKNPDFRMYQEGISPGILACIEQVEREKQTVMAAMGYEHASHLGMMKKLAQYGQHEELDAFRQVAGPSSMTHRYIEEDASAGQALMISLAHSLGLKLPCMEALVCLAGVINGKDYLAQGRTTSFLGWDGLDGDAINTLLQEGEIHSTVPGSVKCMV